ncbi:MAG: glycoside hydrolase family 5 protein [bacterium]
MDLNSLPGSTPYFSPGSFLSLICFTAIIIVLLGVAPCDALGFLRASGEKVIDAQGNPILFTGLNLEFKDFKTALGEEDIQRIADMGANSIRLILDYRDLETSPYHYSREGFALLDSVLRWCETYRIFVILDLHLAPGRQNPHDFVVHREKTYDFWEKRDFQDRFYALWAEIAGRYADRKIVVGYDLLNEGTPPSISEYRRVMNTAAGRIRNRDKNHILIVEEAILPEWTKELVLIDDHNTIYSVHFFYPSEFSFYATTTRRPLTTYPGEMVDAGDAVAETRSETIIGKNGWSELRITATPPDGAEILVVKIASGGNKGSVWFDDIHLEINGRPVDLPAPLIANNSFEIDYPGFVWDTEGSCVNISAQHARTGKYALAFSECMSPASAKSSSLQVEKGTYVLTAWYRSEHATGDTRLSLSWHTRKVLSPVDRMSLLKHLAYALEFKKQNKVPLFIGEFTAHANPSPTSIAQYLQDLLDIMKENELHWSFWEYYSVYPGVGIYTGDTPQIINRTAFDVLSKNLRKR